MRSLRASTFQKWHSDLTELIAENRLVACSRNRTGPEAYETSVLPSHSAATVFLNSFNWLRPEVTILACLRIPPINSREPSPSQPGRNKN